MTDYHFHSPVVGFIMVCPYCRGTGSNNDGYSVYTGKINIDGTVESEVHHKPSTRCPVCRGKRKVRLVPLEDE